MPSVLWCCWLGRAAGRACGL